MVSKSHSYERQKSVMIKTLGSSIKLETPESTLGQEPLTFLGLSFLTCKLEIIIPVMSSAHKALRS